MAGKIKTTATNGDITLEVVTNYEDLNGSGQKEALEDQLRADLEDESDAEEIKSSSTFRKY